MEIKRFEKIEELNVDKIVAKCDHLYAKSINYATQFFEDNTELIFLFADDNEYDGDLTWIEKYDLFSIKILNHITFGSTLAKKIKDRPIVTFVIEKNGYRFYGVYKLEDPYTKEGGLENAVNAETPLVFCFDDTTCDEKNMICF